MVHGLNEMQPAAISQFSRLAEILGPFFFSVLFLTFMTHMAVRYYNRAVSRKDPQATIEEVKTYRLYFLVVVFFSFLLVVASVGWWVYAQSQSNYVYQIAVTDLDTAKTKIDSAYFVKHSMRQSLQ